MEFGLLEAKAKATERERRDRERERKKKEMPAAKETEICKQQAPRLCHALRTFLCHEVFGTRAKHIIWSSHLWDIHAKTYDWALVKQQVLHKRFGQCHLMVFDSVSRFWSFCEFSSYFCTVARAMLLTLGTGWHLWPPIQIEKPAGLKPSMQSACTEDYQPLPYLQSQNDKFCAAYSLRDSDVN